MGHIPTGRRVLFRTQGQPPLADRQAWADRLKAWREAHGLSCRDLGRRLGIPGRGWVSKVEQGSIWPNAREMAKIEAMMMEGVPDGAG